ncbi:MAG TPA: hypothetical protein DHI91_03075 [Candidatus Portnoybacteria bacterium]|nr:hypothetical protein [Candidatus Portnoybacteria bacterium]
MPYRLAKTNELIKQELGKIIFREEEFGQGILLTILDVKSSVNLRDAAITISVLPSLKGEEVLKQLTARIGFLQHQLNKTLNMHPVPRIRFVLNNTKETSQNLDILLNKLKSEDVHD